MTGESLDEVKARLSKRFLGKGGVHGLGVKRSENAVCVYLNPDCGDEGERVLAQIEKEALPFKVVAVKEEPPALT